MLSAWRFIETPEQWIPFDEVAGIKLTEEWIKKFGADMDGDPTFVLNTIDKELFLVEGLTIFYYICTKIKTNDNKTKHMERTLAD